MSDDPRDYKVIQNGFKSLLTAAKNKAKGIDQSVPESVAKERMDICKSCPHFNPTLGNCMICKCFLSVKTKLKQESCPIGQWKACETCGKSVSEK